MSRYLFTEFAESPVAANGRTYQFEKVSFTANHWLGTLEVEDAEVPGLLAVRGVSEISADDYAKLQAQKKTTPSFGRLTSWNNSSRPVVQQKGPPIPIAEKQGAVSAGGNLPKPEPTPEPAGQFPSVDDLLKVEKVAPPTPIVEGERRIGESKKRGKAK